MDLLHLRLGAGNGGGVEREEVLGEAHTEGKAQGTEISMALVKGSCRACQSEVGHAFEARIEGDLETLDSVLYLMKEQSIF